MQKFKTQRLTRDTEVHKNTEIHKNKGIQNKNKNSQ